MQEQKKIKVGVIGTGGISGVHFKNLAQVKQTELVGVCDIAPGKAEAVAKERGGRPYTNFEQMLDKEQPEAVLLLTPQTVRFEPIKACAERGIPMFIEKPPAKNMDEARKISAVIRQHNLLTEVGFVLRFNAAVQKARELLKGRTIHIIRMRYYAPMILQYEKFPPFYFLNEVSGGMIVDQALHFIDLSRYLVGDEINEVHGVGSNLYRPKSKEITTPENVVLSLRFSNGSVGTHAHTWAYNTWMGEIELVTPQARLVLDVFNNKMTGTIDGVNIEYAGSGDAYLVELERFFEVVQSGDRSRILSSFDDAMKTLGVCVAANRSIETRANEKVELS